METITRHITELADDERTVVGRYVDMHLVQNRRIAVQSQGLAGIERVQTPPRSVADYAIVGYLDSASMEFLDFSIPRSPRRGIQCR